MKYKSKKITRIEFKIDSLTPDINNLSIYLIGNHKNIIKCKLKHDTIIFPQKSVLVDSFYDVEFILKNKISLVFNKVGKEHLSDCEQNIIWDVGIDNSPFDKSLGFNNDDVKDSNLIKRFIYWRFMPQEDGDGIYFLKKEYK